MLQFCCENSVKMLCTVEDLKFEASRTLDIWQSNAAVLANNTLEALRVGLEEAHPLSPKHIDVAPPRCQPLAGSSFGSWPSLTRHHRSPSMVAFHGRIEHRESKKFRRRSQFWIYHGYCGYGVWVGSGWYTANHPDHPDHPERNSKRRPPSSQKKSLKKPQT